MGHTRAWMHGVVSLRPVVAAVTYSVPRGGSTVT